MKRIIGWMMVACLIFAGIGNAFAAAATKDEVVAKVKLAAEMIETDGVEATMAKMNDRQGPFAFKGTYVFCMRADSGELLGHPYVPKRFIGIDVNDMEDVTGTKYVRQMLELAAKEGEGWVSHERNLKRKIEYVLSVPKAGVVLAGGYFDGTNYPAPRFEAKDDPVPGLDGKKIAIVLAPQRFEDNEYSVPKILFERAGAGITLFSLQKGAIRGMYGTEAEVNHTLDELAVDQFDAVVFVGGSGVARLHDNPVAHRIAREAMAQQKVVAAICWAPMILAKAGVLDGREATVNPIENAWFRQQGLNCSGKAVSVDGNLVTANGPAASDAFGRAVIDVLIRQRG